MITAGNTGREGWDTIEYQETNEGEWQNKEEERLNHIVNYTET